jgi:membrane-bound lytic murein transglycosylase D
VALPATFLAGCAAPNNPSSPTDTPAPPTVAVPLPPLPASAPEVAPPTQAAAPEAAASDAEAAPQPVAEDPLRPDVHVEIDDRSARIDLWARVRAGFGMPDLDTALVRDRERWYAERPDYVARMMERGSRYLFHIVEELDKRHMPMELALLPFIESAYNPQAMSTARASGMWQFIPSTGRDFELKQNVFRDDRRDVLESTRAALDYLQKLHDMFGDWQLALAAYNWGEGSVQKAVARNQRAGLATDYLSLRMPAETQQYLPKLQAVKNIVTRPQDFGLTLPDLTNHPYFLAVPIERDIDVAVAAQLAGIELEEFQHLNPQMNKPVILAAGTPRILLPYDNANRFVQQLPQHRGRLATWTAWVAPKTMHPAAAAKEVGMSEAQLREVNRIPARMLVKAGSTLLVPRGQTRVADVSPAVADNAVMALAPDAPPLRKVTLKAGKHESVASVAHRYHVSAAQVAQWNNVSAAATFKPGEPVLVYVAAKGRGATHVAAAEEAPARTAKGSSARPSHHATPAPRHGRTSATTQASTAQSAKADKPAPAKKTVRVAHN